MANLSDKVSPSGVLTPTGDGSGLTGVVTIDANGDVTVYGGNGTTDNRTFTVESEGYAVVDLVGDKSNSGDEQGGAGLKVSVDGSTSGVVSMVNSSGENGIGGNYTDMGNNSMLVGTVSNNPLYFGINSKVYAKMSSGNFTLGGLLDDGYPSNNSSGAGIGLGFSGQISALCDDDAAFNGGRHSGFGHVARWQYAGSTVGDISITSSATTYNTSSDYRLKENVTPIQGASDIVKAMNPCTYTAIVDGIWYDGFLAHELQDVLPRAVTGTKDGMKDEEYEVTPATEAEEAIIGTRSVPDMQSVDYAKLTPILVASLQEVLGRIDALEAAIDRMK